MYRRQAVSGLLMLAFSAAIPVAYAHGDKPHRSKGAVVIKEQKDWGIAGDAKSVKRQITVRMSDNMRFSPNQIMVNQGDTIKFVVINQGNMLHEFVIGTKAENAVHAEQMIKFPDMEHDEPYMAHVDPKKRGEIIWTFNKAGEFEFACLIAGHYQAGMLGKIIVLPSKRDKTLAASKS